MVLEAYCSGVVFIGLHPFRISAQWNVVSILFHDVWYCMKSNLLISYLTGGFHYSRCLHRPFCLYSKQTLNLKLITFRVQKDFTVRRAIENWIWECYKFLQPPFHSNSSALDAPKDLTVTEVTETTMILEWKRPMAKLDSYRLVYVSADGHRAEDVVPGSSEAHTLRGLTPGMLYTISIIAERGRRTSAPATISAPTGQLCNLRSSFRCSWLDLVPCWTLHSVLNVWGLKVGLLVQTNKPYPDFR